VTRPTFVRGWNKARVLSEFVYGASIPRVAMNALKFDSMMDAERRIEQIIREALRERAK
jgi:hypothetical protein